MLREIWSGQVVCVGVAEPLGGSLRDKQNVSMCFTSVTEVLHRNPYLNDIRSLVKCLDSVSLSANHNIEDIQ